ncbi:PaaI family thioesterase [Paraburkholderia panacisoli]|uniref:PaaI family thioesterase n=1 Tax=Paraburkholderia panacisoli TaxID=2603818 RepID=A0A5B0GAU6_9BURK|nr:PaaI family thioesterase [Paraburkholderia panacisoli]KAA0999180.1 PaaI family thioesterase [Paraburkholderia panacisoli]
MADIYATTDRAAQPDNPDRAFIEQVLTVGLRDVPLEMNPALRWLGATLLGGANGALSIGFAAPRESLQGNGVVSGGALSSMLDLAMALTLLSRLPHGRTCATISLTVNMLEPAHAGAFTVEARVKRLGGRIAFLEAELYDGAGARCVASATASFAVFDVRN